MWRINMLDETWYEAVIVLEVSIENKLYHCFNIKLILLSCQCNVQIFIKESLETLTILAYGVCKDFVNWLKNKLHKGSFTKLLIGSFGKLPGFMVVVVVTPEQLFKSSWVDLFISLRIFSNEGLNTEHERVLAWCEDYIVQSWTYQVLVLCTQMSSNFLE